MPSKVKQETFAPIIQIEQMLKFICFMFSKEPKPYIYRTDPFGILPVPFPFLYLWGHNS